MTLSVNAFAWLALFGWPLVVLAVYAARGTRARLARTTAWMMLAGEMFLPPALTWKQPLVPELDKHRIVFLSIALALFLFHRRDAVAVGGARRFPRLVLLAIVAGVMGTVRTNGDVVMYGALTLPGLTSHDVMSIAASAFLDLYLPFAVGQRVFRSERDLLDLFEVLTTCAIVYLPLALFELRFSPIFNYWVYGYVQHQFAQQIRGAGYRPLLFMNHGLSVAMFAFSALCAGLALRRAGAASIRPSTGVRVGVGAALVAACKSLGSIVYSLAAVALHRFASARAIARLVVVLAAIVVAYPSMRAAGAFPTQALVQLFGRVSSDRADSLAFRFANEDALVAHAMARPWFGWGTFGRNRVYLETGDDASVTDGYWIIVLGQFGFAGFVATFSLLIVPVLRFARSRRHMPASSQALIGGLALIVAVFAVDCLPNAPSDFLPMAYAGALFAVSDRRRFIRAAAPRARGSARAARSEEVTAA